MNPLVKKGIFLGLAGFAAGVPVGLVFLLLNASGELSVMRVAIQLIFSGILGAVAMGFAVVYEAESWSVTRCTVTHFAITFGTYFAIGFSLGWFPLQDVVTYIMIGSYIVMYFVIWLVMYLISKKQAEELDEELKRWKKTEADQPRKAHE